MQLSVAQHEAVAKHYNISSVNLTGEVADRIKAGTLTWDEFGGTQPGPIGNQLATDLVTGLLTAGWNAAAARPIEVVRHDITPLLTSSFDEGRLLPHDVVKLGHGWTRGVPDWKSIAGSQRERFSEEELLYSDHPGAGLSFSFDGTAIGAYALAGPDAGQLQVRIDGGAWQTVELYHGYSSGLHYPRTVMFGTDLKCGPHTVEVQIGNEHHKKSHGRTARILALVANGSV